MQFRNGVFEATTSAMVLSGYSGQGRSKEKQAVACIFLHAVFSSPPPPLSFGSLCEYEKGGKEGDAW